MKEWMNDTDLSLPIKGRDKWRWIAERTAAILLASALSAFLLLSLFDSIMQRRSRQDSMHIATSINLYNIAQTESPISSVQDAAALYAQLGGEKALCLSYTRFEKALSSVTLRDYGYHIVTAVYSPEISLSASSSS